MPSNKIYVSINKILKRSIGMKIERVTKKEARSDELKAEKEYWANMLNQFYTKYNLKMHPLQSDESVVPPTQMLNKVQYKNHANPDYFFTQSYYDAFSYFNTLEKHNVKLGRIDSILDFGVGFGRLLINFFPFSANLFGCDITPEAVSWSKEKYSDRATISLTYSDPPLPYADSSFDLIYSNAVFIHIPYVKQDQWIAELKRISRPGGHVLVTYYEPSFYFSDWSRSEIHEKFTKPGWYELPGENGLNYEAVNTFIERDVILQKWSDCFEVIDFIPRFKKHSLLIVRNKE